MKQRARVDGREIEIDAEDASVLAVAPGVYSIEHRGRTWQVRVVDSAQGCEVHIGGRRILVELVDPRSWQRDSKSITSAGVQSVIAPMPGKVVRVLASAGDEVTAGQGILVVEAMKMQNEIQAPKAGRLVSIAVEAGAAVSAGDVLATVE